MMNFLKSLVVVILVSQTVFAEDTLEHIKYLPDGASSPSASLEDVSWLEGHWRGQALGGEVEEVWSPPLGGSMMGSFKLVAGGAVKFYELQTISEEDGTLMYRLKHFNRDMTGWEEKAEVVEFKLVDVTDNKVFFSGLTLERIDDQNIIIYVAFKSNGTVSELAFPYAKVGM